MLRKINQKLTAVCQLKKLSNVFDRLLSFLYVVGLDGDVDPEGILGQAHVNVEETAAHLFAV